MKTILKFKFDHNLKSSNTPARINAYSKAELVVLVPFAGDIFLSWVSPTGVKFPEAKLVRNKNYDEGLHLGYTFDVRMNMTAGVVGDIGHAIFSIRYGLNTSGLIRVPVVNSILPDDVGANSSAGNDHIVFDRYEDFKLWFSGEYVRPDELTPRDLEVGDIIIVEDRDDRLYFVRKWTEQESDLLMYKLGGYSFYAQNTQPQLEEGDLWIDTSFEAELDTAKAVPFTRFVKPVMTNTEETVFKAQTFRDEEGNFKR